MSRIVCGGLHSGGRKSECLPSDNVTRTVDFCLGTPFAVWPSYMCLSDSRINVDIAVLELFCHLVGASL